MSSIYDNVISQYIDSHGKCRILNYDNNLSIIVSPIAPIDVKQVSIEKSLSVNPSTQYVVQYIVDKNLGDIVEQIQLDEKQAIKGVWVNNKELRLAYIPISSIDGENNPIENIEASHPGIIEPLISESNSKLDVMKRNKLLALYLKEYSLYLFSQKNELSPSDFIVDSKHNYDIDQLLKYNNINSDNSMYRDNKIYVNEKETVNRLINYVNIQHINDSFIKYNYKNIKNINIRKHFTPNQFKTNNDEMIFSDKELILFWKNNRNSSKTIVSENIKVDKLPYYYKSYYINNGNIVLIQHVQNNDLECARSVSEYWQKYGINPGFNHYPETPSKLKTLVYNVIDETYKEINGTEELNKKKKINIIDETYKEINGTEELNKKEKINIIDFGDEKYASVLTL